MDQEEQIVVIDNTPRPFREIPELWLKFWKMDAEFFKNELPRASKINTLRGILLYSVIFSAITIIYTSLYSFIYPEQTLAQFGATANVDAYIQKEFFSFLILTPIGFYISNIISYIPAKLVKGKADFKTQAYISSLIWPPLSLTSSLLNYFLLIPVYGYCIRILLGLGFGFYSLVFSIRATKNTHDISTEKVISIIIISIILSLILWFLCFLIMVRLGLYTPK